MAKPKVRTLDGKEDPFQAMNDQGKPAPVVDSTESVDEADPAIQDETPLEPSTPEVPQPESLYRLSADPLLITSLELFERLDAGRLLLPNAYSVRAEVERVIGEIKAKVLNS